MLQKLLIFPFPPSSVDGSLQRTHNKIKSFHNFSKSFTSPLPLAAFFRIMRSLPRKPLWHTFCSCAGERRAKSAPTLRAGAWFISVLGHLSAPCRIAHLFRRVAGPVAGWFFPGQGGPWGVGAWPPKRPSP
jgi:hypothetical protein